MLYNFLCVEGVNICKILFLTGLNLKGIKFCEILCGLDVSKGFNFKAENLTLC